MVRYCYVCKIYSYQPESQGLSFHRLPNEPSRRAIWISLLGFEKNHPFPKYVDICPKHFHESDFVYLADGVRHLRMNAAPIPVHTAFDFAESIRLKFDEDFILPGPSSQVSSVPVTADDQNSSSTVTASEADDQSYSADKITPPK
nr:unnamed protein product [Callosobruchus chinensis]